MFNKSFSLFGISTVLMLLLSSQGYAEDTTTNSELKTNKTITVNVAIDEDLAPKNASEWVLYIYAARPNTRIPLSSHKTTLDKLPLEITLDESMFILPAHTMKDVSEVVVIAKASKGEYTHKRNTEDLIGYSKPVSFESGPKQSINVEINENDKP
jgi:hypothetical protein